jgi:hypothetical protein
MPEIPQSYGIVVNPSFKSNIAMPDTQASQMTSQLGQQLSSNLMNIATQIQYQNIKEEESFNAAQVIDFRTKLATFENDKRIALNELSPNDPKLLEETKKNFQTERQEFINNYLSNYTDNKKLSSLIKRQADAENVDFNFDVDRTLSNKKREYGTNKIYEGIYSVNQRLQNGGNAAKLSNELNLILQTGLQSGLIDQNDINREKDKQKSIIEDLQKKYELTKQANLVANGQIVVDPTDSEDRKLAELAFQTQLEGTIKRNGNPEAMTMNFIQKTGYVPNQIKNNYSAMLNVGNPSERIAIAENIASLVESNSRLQNQFNSDDINFVYAIKSRLNTGLPAENIIQYAEKDMNKFQSMDRIAKKQVLRDQKKQLDNKFENLKDDLSNPNFIELLKSNPQIEDGIKKDYETLVNDVFLDNPNATFDGATEFAKNQLKNTYKITTVGKKRVMKDAPESFFSGDTSWINKQFERIIKNVKGKDVNLDNYVLQPVANEIKKGKPIYGIVEVDQYGQMNVVLDQNNQKLYFQPNLKQVKK